MNHELRRLQVLNLTRSKAPVLAYVVGLPSSTAPLAITAFIDSVRAYASDSPDWTSGSGAMCGAEYGKGLVRVALTLTSAHKRHEAVKLEEATSRLSLFVHTYLRQAGITYMQPKQMIAQLGDAVAPGRFAHALPG